MASTVLYQGGRFTFSLAAALSLMAADFTAWALVVAFLAYVPALTLGITNGMSRELPILIARGATRAGDRTIAAAWAATGAASAALLLAGFVGASLPEPGVTAMILAVLGSATMVFGTQQFVLRSRLRFTAASAQQAVFGALALVASAGLATASNADLVTPAVLYGAALSVAIIAGFIMSPPVRFDVKPDEMRRLAAIGFPIMLAGVAFSLLVTLDRWIATTILGPERAAPYALASLLSAAMLVVPAVVSQHTYPRMAMALGGGSNTTELRDMARRQGRTATGLVMPVGAAILLFAWIGVPLALPRYGEAIPAVTILVIGYTFLAYLTGYGNYLNVIGGQWRYFRSQMAAVTIGVVLMVLGGFLFGIAGIAAGMAVSHIAYGAILHATAQRMAG